MRYLIGCRRRAAMPWAQAPPRRKNQPGDL